MINSLSFWIMTEKEIKNLSVMTIINEKDLTNKKFGSISEKHTCTTCNKRKECSGHIGMIDLGEYIVHPMYEHSLTTFINSHCHKCGTAKKTVRCSNCKGSSSITFKHISTNNGILTDNKKILNYKDIIDISNLVSNNNDAKKMLIRYIPVPPPRLRLALAEFPEATELSRAYIQLLRGLVHANNHKKFILYKRIAGSKSTSAVYNLISGKEGLFRSTVFGKRINRSGRAVIAGDPYLKVDEVGIPEIIASSLFMDVDILFSNYKYLSGMELYNSNGEILKHILPGTKAYRRCKDGDMVCLNRQPSLSKYSLLSFKVKIHNIGNVIFINPCVTPSFNADFDGDEMNIFLINKNTNRSELQDIMYVGNNLKYIKPVQDTITGLYLMTICPKFVTKSFIYDLAIDNNIDHIKRCEISNNTLSLVSLCLPEDMTYIDDDVNIVNGVFYNGILTNKSLGNMMLYIQNNYDLLMFQHKTQIIVTKWISSYGLTVTLDNCMDEIKGHKESIQHIGNTSFRDEEYAKYCINQLRVDVEESIANHDNNLLHMIKSGAKGNTSNFMHITTYVGQQYVNGDRLLMFDDNKGFCSSSFSEGLTPEEFFFHQMAAREGIVNTSINTATTGYLSRRVSKTMSEIIIDNNNRTVDNDRIIRF